MANNDRGHVGRKHRTGPHGVVATRDDLGAVDGNARHVRNLVGQDGAIDKPHKEEGDNKQPKRRALLDARPANVNLRSRVLVLVAGRRDGRIARVLAERLQVNLGRLGAEGEAVMGSAATMQIAASTRKAERQPTLTISELTMGDRIAPPKPEPESAMEMARLAWP